jgi:Trypsin-like peptidase domain
MTRRALAVALSGGLLGACGDPAPAPPVPVCGALQTAPVTRHAQCGATLDVTPINAYHGELASAQDREGAVVLIDGDCTGTLIAAAAGPVVLTAGHCVGLADRALIAFNVEADPDGDPLVTNGTVIEQALEPDYALIALDQLPAIAPTLLTTQSTERLAIIQHPRGGPKVVAEGDFLAECQGVISYTDLDTLAGSSGAGVLNHQGYLLAVHTDGDCNEDGSGSNHGWSAARIVSASTYLQAGDLADR